MNPHIQFESSKESVEFGVWNRRYPPQRCRQERNVQQTLFQHKSQTNIDHEDRQYVKRQKRLLSVKVHGDREKHDDSLIHQHLLSHWNVCTFFLGPLRKLNHRVPGNATCVVGNCWVKLLRLYLITHRWHLYNQCTIYDNVTVLTCPSLCE